MNAVLSQLVGVLGAVFLFACVVFVHELGHFITAKLLGVGVDKFAIGFGPVIWSVRRGETEYSVRWLPLGGFVALKGAMHDEDEEETTENGKPQRGASEDLDALRSKHPLARIAVFASGVTFNFITAVLVMAALLWYGQTPPAPVEPVVDGVVPGSAWHDAGWRTGDRIVEVAWESDEGETRRVETERWNDVETAVAAAVLDPDAKRPGDGSFTFWAIRSLFQDDAPSTASAAEAPEISMTVRRDEQRVTLPWPRETAAANPEDAFFGPRLPPIVGAVLPNSPADKTRLVQKPHTPGAPIDRFPSWEDMPNRPLMKGDRILAVEGERVSSWYEMTRRLQANPNQMITLSVARAGDDGTTETMLLAATLESDAEAPSKGRLGIIRGPKFALKRERMNPLGALLAAPKATVVFADRLIGMQIQYLANSSWTDVKRGMGGPLAIAKMSYQNARRGIEDYLNLFIAINIMLAALNILPVPVLDGGYIVITIIETAIRRPIPNRILKAVLTTFMILFLLLFVFIFYNDFMNHVFKI